MAVANLLRKAPTSYAVAKRVLSEFRKRNPSFLPENVLDFGAGLGPWTWAIDELFPECKNLVCIEPNTYMRKLGRFLTENIKKC